MLSVLQQPQPSFIPFLDNINIPRWNGCGAKVRRNVRNAEPQMKSCIIQVKEEEKKGQLIILLTTKRRLEIMLNCHSGLLSGNSLGCFRCCESCHEPENNGTTLTALSPYPIAHPTHWLPFLSSPRLTRSQTRQQHWQTSETLLFSPLPGRDSGSALWPLISSAIKIKLVIGDCLRRSEEQSTTQSFVSGIKNEDVVFLHSQSHGCVQIK